MRRPTLAFAIAALALPAFAKDGHAQTAAGATQEDALIKQGLDLRRGGQDEAALQSFRQAYAIAKSSRAIAQVALAEEALGHWVDAEAHLLEALRNESETWIAQHKAVLSGALRDIQGHLGSVELSGGIPEAAILLNGQPAGKLPLTTPLRAPAGTVALEVNAPGYLPIVRSVVVPAGGTAREVVVLVRLPDRPADASVKTGASTETGAAQRTALGSAPTGDHWSNRKLLGLVSGAAGVIGLGTGLTFSIVYNSRAKAFNDAGCFTGLPNDGPAGCTSKHDSVRSAEFIAIGGYVSAALLGGVGAYLFFSAPQETTPSLAFHGRAASLRCVLAPSSEPGIACVGRF